MTNNRRRNWKQALANHSQEKEKQRQDLLTQLEANRTTVRGMTMEEVRSDAYLQLMRERAQIMTNLALLD